MRALGGQSAPDQGVEDRQGQLDRVPVGTPHVGEGPDGLLRQPEVGVGVQGHDVTVREGRGEERDDPFVPLPRMHGEQQVVGGVQSA